MTRRPIIVMAGCAVVACICGFWFHGLTRFVESIPRQLDDKGSRVDAVIVPTGSSERLRVGFDLLARDDNLALFISGVSPGVTLRSLLTVSGIDPESFQEEARVWIGYEARNTLENAGETADWVARHDIGSLRLVTENYHLPRSLNAFRQAMPRVTIIPHPVILRDIHLDSWWRWPGTTWLLIGEYNKYLIAHVSRLWRAG